MSDARGAPGGRQANLARLLARVHASAPSTRAQLTRALGLNRSTIASLVGELVELGILREQDAPERGVVGRPSPLVRFRDEVVAIGVGVELDAVTVAIVDGHGGVVQRLREDTDGIPDPATTVEVAHRLAQQAMAPRAGLRPIGVGIAVPGLVRASDGVVRIAPHLDWHEEPIAAMLHDAFALPAFADNDANLGADAESLHGAGRDAASLVYLHGGPSGIGSGVRIGGGQLSSLHGMHAELGHTVVDIHGRRCHCSGRGCLETEVRYSTLLDALGLETLDLLDLSPALRAARSPALDRIVAEQLERLAVGIRTAVNAFNPERIVLGGFLGAIYDEQPETLDVALRSQVMAPLLEGMTIVRGTLGVNRLLIGAAGRAWQPFLADPLAWPRAASA